MQIERIKLTPGRMAAFICPQGKDQAILRDAEQVGLGLRVTHAGARAYIFQGKLAGQVIRMTIGDPKDWNLDAARKEARRLKGLIDEGRDPRQVKADQTAADQAKRRQERVSKTPAMEAWGAYIQARTAKWSDRHKADHEEYSRPGGEPITRGRRKGGGVVKEPGILRSLLDLPLRDITRDRVKSWVEAESGTRAGATRRALACFGAFISWASTNPEYRDDVHQDACDKLSRELPKPGVKDDCLQREQLKPWFKAVRALQNRTVSAYLQIVLLTGARRRELGSLRWDDVDFQWHSLTIRDKVEGERTIGMTPYVESLLRELEAMNMACRSNVVNLQGQSAGDGWKPSPWVFASKTAKDGRLQEPRAGHNKALAAAGLPAMSIHGLRRSFGTLAEWVECPAGISAQIMGHKPSAIAEKHYRRRPLDLLRMWHGKIEAWMLEQAGIEFVAESSEAAMRLEAVA